ncbi:MAG: hypothetical protein Q9205_003180 [Flavoplaca limonia]
MDESNLQGGEFCAQQQLVEGIAAEYSNTDSIVAENSDSVLVKYGLLFAVALHSQPARFALELIQNADDAEFTRIRGSDVPFIAFESHDEHRIHVRSNQDGFSDKDVKALCNFGRTTKKSTVAIGGNGMGFKPVFKLCDSVQIGSNGFQFSLNEYGPPFSLVRPKWKLFQEWLEDQQNTYVLLHLKRNRHALFHLDYVESLEPSILLFLRHIEELIVHTHEQGYPDYRQVMTCHDRGQQVITVTTKSWSGGQELASHTDEFAMVHYRSSPSSPGITLAFPRLVDGELQPQQVHRFLPIRSYGFKFIIQAHFHLTCSREAILEGSSWNHELRDLVPPAFLSAVQICNESRKDRISWLQYLPDSSELQDFFSSMDIGQYLANEKILFAQSEQLMLPSDLMYVPPQFRLEKQRILPLAFNRRHALSTYYDDCNIKVLQKLGVEHLTMQTFLSTLEELGDRNWLDVTWHEDLAKILLSFEIGRLGRIPLIPVACKRSIEWIRPDSIKGKPTYLQKDLEVHRIPEGVEMQLVPAEASQSRHRLLLFEKLGLKSLSIAVICEAITAGLQCKSSPPSIAIAVIQTKYLFLHRKAITSPKIAFWATIDGQARTASIFQQETYWMDASSLCFDDPRQKPHLISQLLCSFDRFHLLHADYLQEDERINMVDWMDWLIERGMNVCPCPVTAGNHSRASADFLHMAKHVRDDSLCEVLLKNQDLYERYMHVIMSPLQERLGQRILPSPLLRSIVRKMEIPPQWVQFLDVTVRAEQKLGYQWLNHFGLITEGNGLFFLEILRYHRDLSTRSPTKELLHAIYVALQSCSDTKRIRVAFENERLIAVDTKSNKFGGKQWLPANECFWSISGHLCFNMGLSAQYQDCERLFRVTVGIADMATMDHIMTDLRRLAETSDVQLITDNVQHCLIKLSALLKRAKEDNLHPLPEYEAWKGRLEKLRIWPIVTGDDKLPILVYSREFCSNSFLFVADRADLHELFRSKVPLLNFTPDEVSEMNCLMKWLPSPRYLSKEVKTKILDNDSKSLQESMTTDYDRKREAILRCLQHYLPTSNNFHIMRPQLNPIKVFEIDTVRKVCSVYHKASEYRSGLFIEEYLSWEPEDAVTVETCSDVMVEHDYHSTTIYVTKDEKVQKKAMYRHIPEMLRSALGLPIKAKEAVYAALRLDPSLSSSILDEMGIAQLPGTVIILPSSEPTHD